MVPSLVKAELKVMNDMVLIKPLRVLFNAEDTSRQHHQSRNDLFVLLNTLKKGAIRVATTGAEV